MQASSHFIQVIKLVDFLGWNLLVFVLMELLLYSTHKEEISKS